MSENQLSEKDIAPTEINSSSEVTNTQQLSISNILNTDNTNNTNMTNDNDDNNEQPALKRIKLEHSDSKADLQVASNSSSASPVPQVLTSESKPLIQSQISEFTTGNSKTSQFENVNSELSSNIKHSKDLKPVINKEGIQATKAQLVAESGRKIEDIIDGSDLRKFLNKTLTESIVKGLDEIVKLWENGEFNSDLETEQLKKNVILKFANILKQNVEN